MTTEIEAMFQTHQIGAFGDWCSVPGASTCRRDRYPLRAAGGERLA
jgi:hypothetical protein